MTSQKLIKGQAATLVGYPPRLYAPSAVKVRFQTPATPLPAAGDEVDASAEGLSATTNADAILGARKLTFDGDPGFTPGRRYGVRTDSGAFAIVVTGTGTTVTVESPLPMPVPSGSSVFSLAVTIPLTADDTATAGQNGSAKWRATLNGDVVDWDQAFSIVDEVIPVPVTVDQLLNLWPQSRRSRTGIDDDLQSLRAATWELHLVPELESRGVRPDLINDGAPLVPAFIAAAKMVVHEDADPTDVLTYESLHRRFIYQLNLAMARTDWWAATSDEEDLGAEVGSSDVPGRIRRVY